jgi:uncharacterized protein
MSDPSRNSAVDLIRTAALIGICVVNLPFLALPGAALMQVPATPADRLAADLVQLLFEGKFFLLFSFLFGWGMQVQMQAAARKGQAFAPRYARRLAGLVILGGAHAILVFTGDILVLYALLGALAWPLRNAPPRRLLRLAIAMVPAALLGLVLLAVLVEVGLPEPDYRALAHGFWQATLIRSAEWPPTFVILLLFQGPLAFGAILMGLAAAQTGFFQPDSTGRRLLRRAFPWTLTIGLALNLVVALSPMDDSPRALIGLLLVAPAAPILSMAWFHGLLWLANRLSIPEILQRAGQNSLSAYLLQGILAGLVFGGHGLGLFDQLGQAVLLPLAILIALLAMVLTGLMAGRWGRGPFEVILRRLTYGPTRS